MKKHLRIILILILVLLVMFFVYNKKQQAIKYGKISVIAADYPTYSITKQIAGNLINLDMFIPPGQDSHHFELKPSDIIKLSDTNLFIYTSYELEPWVKDIESSYKGKKPLMFVNTTKNTENKESLHAWLNFYNVKIMADQITFYLTSIDEKNRAIYLENLEAFKQDINKLGKEFVSQLSNCKRKTIVHIGHDAFGDMSNKLGLHFVPVQNEEATNQPSAKQVGQLINHINSKNIEYIFTEKMLNPSFAKMISNETNTKVLLLNPIDGISKMDFERNKTYQDLMRVNLKNISKGLNCQKK
ncbi:MAG: zinc ABC transporter substrate-binding protein [Elusimicrobiaceae bacterium]|nr:zinc ABC transporter substrate-binding protein [Elusimicrobiaceae bacterium]MBT3955305.1 zinc ABC transporter substrate-binding protein [Elusimicrobiaceae bacterium]MBT4008441.1 zinc ABC transporter substrate-binding protein [Elusimicrobiaceae bacterium]MBT4403250.1 zinc ABC transporter substrate-binding protein [Elusimicrobiaceae bacterium]MBT4440170.1 zinc ABC transporter substrate-binding protein [Elusimicrobiaceae bacterium]